MVVRVLAASDNIAGFASGQNELDRWFQRHARDNQFLFGTTYVAVDGDDLIGFVTVAATSIERARVGAAGPSTWPALLLGRMAVSKAHQRRGVGAEMMRHVFTVAVQQHYLTGCAVVVVDAKPDAVMYYDRYGFLPVAREVLGPPAPPDYVQMYMSIGTIVEATGTMDLAASGG